MPDYHHGVRVLELTEGVRPIRTVATAVIGLVATGPDADADIFPVDTPVLITDPAGAVGSAGVEGTLAIALQSIAEITRAVVVVVRVEEGEDAAETAANVIGANTAGVRTGMQALLTAESVVGVRPRILGVPGQETQAVITALASVAIALRAQAYVVFPEADAETIAAAITYRENFSQRELCPIYGDWLSFDTVSATTITRPAAAVALGLRAWIDQNVGWHKTLSNVAVEGVTGVSKPVTWDLQNPSTDAGLLNAAGITALIRSTGFRFWGNGTCSDDPLFAFESAARTAAILKDTIAEGMMWAMDLPLTPSLARDVVETINAKLRSLTSQGYLLGGECWIDPSVNPAEDLAAGILNIDYDYTPVPPLEQLGLRQRITDRYLANFAAQVAQA